MYTTWSYLEAFMACELLSKVLDIPSWVPDWSTPLKREDNYFTTGNTSARIAAQPTFDKTGLRCTVSGVRAGLVQSRRFTREEFNRFVRALKPPEESSTDLYMTGHTLSEVCCRVLVANGFRDTRLPPDPRLPDFARSLNLLKLAWSDDASGTDFGHVHSNLHFHHMQQVTQTRWVCKTPEGYLGLAPIEAQFGDVLCVLLNCAFPVILRIAASYTWLLVGPCYAHGLMNGEGIYRNSRFNRSGRDGHTEMFNPENGLPYLSAEETLEEGGIKVESTREAPYQPFVAPEILRAAGIQVEDFV
ncbi:hypothetical protein BU25DRAFT_247471 [Macroventuria anomochaeta]|uniref:Uncharacterized protein n=1 Tax=Macroventuria anomochaeta TaxID=301207 RepID=A0ACB6SBQ4_9PLEO|nr:uncharacterized protein BU25DRAFT_247471 [Macroventuria anomochaeta]KAF2630773.1 hypothetical protein BU25DRAFT_247471 [Macroventuria anomochaeta]